MKRRIAIVTSSRAEYGHLYWLLRDLAADPYFDLRLIVMGAHLSPEFGHTVQEIRRDGFAIEAEIECLVSSDSDVGMAKTIGISVLGLADQLARIRPDLLLLIADRYEMLAPASVALALRIPIAHIEGGDVSRGAIDDAVRNALTKLSHIHFACTANARRRIVAMGEEPWRVHLTGSPALDHLWRSQLLDARKLEGVLGLELEPAPVLVLYHPVTLLRDTTEEAEELFSALALLDRPLIFVYPNADAGSRSLIERTRALQKSRAGVKLFVNLDHITFLSLLMVSTAMVGNSSSGIMEAASFALPVVNVGIRQQGREHAENVLDAVAERKDIAAKLKTALSPDFRRQIEKVVNPYGDGHSVPRILAVLKEVQLGQSLLMKAPVPLGAI